MEALWRGKLNFLLLSFKFLEFGENSLARNFVKFRRILPAAINFLLASTGSSNLDWVVKWDESEGTKFDAVLAVKLEN